MQRIEPIKPRRKPKSQRRIMSNCWLQSGGWRKRRLRPTGSCWSPTNGWSPPSTWCPRQGRGSSGRLSAWLKIASHLAPIVISGKCWGSTSVRILLPPHKMRGSWWLQLGNLPSWIQIPALIEGWQKRALEFSGTTSQFCTGIFWPSKISSVATAPSVSGGHRTLWSPRLQTMIGK